MTSNNNNSPTRVLLFSALGILAFSVFIAPVAIRIVESRRAASDDALNSASVDKVPDAIQLHIPVVQTAEGERTCVVNLDFSNGAVSVKPTVGDVLAPSAKLELRRTLEPKASAVTSVWLAPCNLLSLSPYYQVTGPAQIGWVTSNTYFNEGAPDELRFVIAVHDEIPDLATLTGLEGDAGSDLAAPELASYGFWSWDDSGKYTIEYAENTLNLFHLGY